MTTPLQTALQCFAAVARRHGVDVSVERLVHEHPLGPDEKAAPKLVAIAHGAGFEAKLQRITWGDLQALDEGFPTIAFLTNGNAVILAGMRGEKVAVLDPLSDRPGMLQLDEATFSRSWTGEVLFVRRKAPKWTIGEKRRFGLSWFAPEVWRQKSILRDVVLAA